MSRASIQSSEAGSRRTFPLWPGAGVTRESRKGLGTSFTLSPELVEQIRRIEITARHLVVDVFAGEYQSVFKGRGMEFEEVRPYYPGDDVRRIDWNVTARMATPFVRRYQEERELTVMLVVDASGSSEFGTMGGFKRELAAEIAAVLSFAATSNNDRIGLMVFTDRVELLVRPRKGRRHVLRMVRDLLVFEPEWHRHGHQLGAERDESAAETAQHRVSDFGLHRAAGLLPARVGGIVQKARRRRDRPA